MSNTFQIGQKVKIVASTYKPSSNTRALIGSICEIQSCDESDNVYMVWQPDGEDFWFFNELDLEAVHEPEPAKSKMPVSKTYKATKDFHISKDVLNSRIDELSEEMLIELTKLGLFELVEETPQIDLTKPLYFTEELKMGQSYYYTYEDGDATEGIWDGGMVDKYLFRSGNCYPTEAHAQKALEIMEAVREFKRICLKYKVNYYEALFDLKNKQKINLTAFNRELDQMADRLDLVLLQHLI